MTRIRSFLTRLPVAQGVALVAICASLGASAAMAQTEGAGAMALGIKGGTTGYGFSAQYRLNEYVVVRGDMDRLNLSKTVSSDGIDYAGDMKFNTFSVGLDYHPTANGFFVTAALVTGTRDATMTATPTTSRTIGGNTYTPAQIGTLTGKADFGASKPMIGMGWDNTLYGDGPWHIAFVAGAILSSTPEVTLTSNGTATSLPGYQADLNAEAAKVAKDIEEYKTYPVIGVTFGYRF